MFIYMCIRILQLQTEEKKVPLTLMRTCRNVYEYRIKLFEKKKKHNMRARVPACVCCQIEKRCLDGRQCARLDIESEIALDYCVRTLRKLVYEHIYTIILSLPLTQDRWSNVH